MHLTSTISRFAAPLALVAMLGAASGCKAREIGVEFANQQASSVDPSWVTALKSCWPGVAHIGDSDDALSHQLADPIHFRASFAAYAALSDAQINSLVTRSISQAPTPPDSSMLNNSATPVLTLQQAAAGVLPPRNAVDTNAPPNALCAVHPGTPLGFK